MRNLDPVKIGSRIRSARQSKGMTVESLANAIGISKGSLSAIETGKRPVSLLNLTRISDVLDISLDYLVGLSDNPERR